MTIFSLQNIWPILKTKINEKIDQISSTTLDNDDAFLLKSKINDFEENCINEIIKFQWPSEKNFSLEYEKNLKSEVKLVHGVMGQVLDIYSDFFHPFIKNVEFDSTNPADQKLPSSIKFRYYNIELRHPQNDKPDFKKCSIAYAKNLLKLDKHKTELMQGYWQTESMIREMRNHQEHWKRDGKDILDQLKRRMEDPISEAETTANAFTLCSALTLMSHQFIEILQTWLDTSKLIEK